MKRNKYLMVLFIECGIVSDLLPLIYIHLLSFSTQFFLFLRAYLKTYFCLFCLLWSDIVD